MTRLGLLIVFVAANGCASMSPSDMCAETQDCPVFEFDEDRYPVNARDATIELTPSETGAWVTISGGAAPVLGALGKPDQYVAPQASGMLEAEPPATLVDVPTCSELRAGETAREGIITGTPDTAVHPAGGQLAVWVEGAVNYSGSRFSGEGESMSCVVQQEPVDIAMKVARIDSASGTVELCYTLPLKEEPVYDVAVASSATRLHFAIAGGEDRKTHVRYLSVDASELCTAPD